MFTNANSKNDFWIAASKIGFASVAIPDETQKTVAVKSIKVSKTKTGSKMLITTLALGVGTRP